MHSLIWIPYLCEDPYRNMARDLALRATALRHSWIRFYDWQNPALSVGFSQRLSDIPGELLDDSTLIIRRPTGGGIVQHHGVDQKDLFGPQFTYSAFFKSDTLWGSLSSVDFYCELHQRLAAVLRKANPTEEISLVQCAISRPPGQCFLEPVPADIICSRTAQKLAGAGLRRNREGILCQGQIQLPDGWTLNPTEWKNLWETEFDVCDSLIPDGSGFLSRIESLTAQFMSSSWIEKGRKLG